jgi:hypothetical protein
VRRDPKERPLPRRVPPPIPSVADILTRLALGIALLACIVSPAPATIFPPGPGGACPDTLAVRDVQDPTVVCHAATGDTVWGLRGIITGFDTKPTGFGFYLQNSFVPGPLPWTGVFINTLVVDYRSTPFNLAQGDSVVVYGRTTEFQSETEIIAPNNSFATPNLIVRKISAGNALPLVATGTTADFNWDPFLSASTAEPWEGCFVRLVAPLRVARTQIGAGVVANTFLIVNPGSPADSVLIDGATLTTVAPPTVGTSLNSVRGILNQRLSGGVPHYRIQLRDSADVSIVPPTPQNVTATAQCGSTIVSWDTAPGASGYKVKRDGVVISGGTQIAGPPFVDANPGIIQRCYTVCAVVLDSLDGGCASAVCATAPDVAPTVTDPSDRAYAVGAPGGLSVFTTGVGLTYVWRKDGVPIPGAPSARTLTFPSIQAGDAGSYDVLVCNACGCDTSAVATLSVCPAVTIAPLPAVVRAIVGAASAQISTTVSGATSMNWYLRGAPLVDGAKYSGATTSTLTISNVGTGDTGLYELHATPSCGAVKRSNSCQLKVAACTTTLTIATQPVSHTVVPGDPVTLSIFVPSCTTPNYQWVRLLSGKWIPIAGATSPQYTIPSFTPADAGSYRCVVTAPGAKATISSNATLNLLVPRFLTMTALALTCTSARVKWTSNVEVTVIAKYGTACGSLSAEAPESPLSTSGSADISLPNRSSAIVRLFGETEDNKPVLSTCMTAYFRNTPASLRVQVQGLPAYGDLYGTDDGIPIRIRLDNAGCADIVGPIVLTQLSAAGKAPRNPDHSIDLPQDLGIMGLAAGQSLVIDDVMFSRDEVGALPGATITVAGTIQYGTPSRTVRVSARIRLP